MQCDRSHRTVAEKEYHSRYYMAKEEHAVWLPGVKEPADKDIAALVD